VFGWTCAPRLHLIYDSAGTLFRKIPIPRIVHVLSLYSLFPTLSPSTAVPRPRFHPPKIYIIVLPESPLNRAAERDSAGTLFRVDGRISDLTNKRIEG